MADGTWLLHNLTLPQRSNLVSLVRATYAAIDMLNARDRFGKACCWLSRDDEPKTALEQLVAHVGDHDIAHPGSACDYSDVVGYEWWLQIRPPRAGMPFHHDTNWNDHESGVTESLTFARCSTVTFLSDSGGPLVVLAPHDASREAQPILGARDDPGAYERLLNATLHTGGHTAHMTLPAFGKHVRFRGALYHGVLSAPVPDDINDRVALVVAHWTRPMQHVRRFPREQMAAKLNRLGIPQSDDEWRALSILDPSPFVAPDGGAPPGAADGACSADEILWHDEPADSTRTMVASKDALTRGPLHLSLPSTLEAGASMRVHDVGLASGVPT